MTTEITVFGYAALPLAGEGWEERRGWVVRGGVGLRMAVLLDPAQRLAERLTMVSAYALADAEHQRRTLCGGDWERVIFTTPDEFPPGAPLDYGFEAVYRRLESDLDLGDAILRLSLRAPPEIFGAALIDLDAAAAAMTIKPTRPRSQVARNVVKAPRRAAPPYRRVETLRGGAGARALAAALALEACDMDALPFEAPGLGRVVLRPLGEGAIRTPLDLRMAWTLLIDGAAGPIAVALHGALDDEDLRPDAQRAALMRVVAASQGLARLKAPLAPLIHEAAQAGALALYNDCWSDGAPMALETFAATFDAPPSAEMDETGGLDLYFPDKAGLFGGHDLRVALDQTGALVDAGVG